MIRTVTENNDIKDCDDVVDRRYDDVYGTESLQRLLLHYSYTPGKFPYDLTSHAVCVDCRH